MRALTDNIPLKLLALVAAVALWYLFAGEAEVATSVPVLIEYQNAPAELDVTSELPSRLFLKVRGPSSRLRSTALSETTLRLDFSAVDSAGERTFDIDDGNLGLPAGVHLVRVVPSQLRLNFERRVSKYVPVEVRYAGPPASGYRVAAQTVIPSTVEVVGPEPRVGAIQWVTTDPIDLASTVSTSEFRVPLFIGDPQVQLRSESDLVNVRVTLEKIPQE
jgi:hypothetical protein